MASEAQAAVMTVRVFYLARPPFAGKKDKSENRIFHVISCRHPLHTRTLLSRFIALPLTRAS